MPVRFIIGRAGTGKTRRCYDQIVRLMRDEPLGKPIVWLLPRQATFEAERQLICASGLGAFCRTRVVSFQQLATDVLSECGGTAVPEVTALGRQMVLGRLLRQHADELIFFKSVARQPGLAAELDSTFAELERTGRDESALGEMIEQLEDARGQDPDAAPLLAKLRDLRHIYAAYLKFLGNDRIDPHGRSKEVLGAIDRCASLSGSTVFVDGFLDFTDQERRLLVGLARVCASMQISVLTDPHSPTLRDPHLIPDEMRLFHRPEQTYRRLWFAFNEAGVKIEAPVVLDAPKRFVSPALSHLESMFDAPTPAPHAGEVSAVELVECPGARDEVNTAARAVKGWMARGVRLRDISVLVRKLDDYADLITASFREHDIPLFIDRRRTAAHHPVLQFIRSALLIARRHWPHEAVMTLVKTSLASLSRDEADRLENYVITHRIKGSAWAREQPWTFQRKSTLRHDEGPDAPASPGFVEAADANALRERVATPMRPFLSRLSEQKEMTVREIVVALFTLIDAFGVRTTLTRWMQTATDAGRFEQRAEHEQVWANLVELFDQMTDLLGDQPVALSEFCDVLESGLEQFDLALTPPTLDQVLVGQVDRTRTSNPRVVIVLGLSQGQFPLMQREGTVLSDTDRRTLRKRKIDIESDTQRKLLDEQLLGYIALTRASEHLMLTRPTTDASGRPLSPSVFWERVRELLPGVLPRTEGTSDTDALSCIATPRQLVTRLMCWARRVSDAPASGENPDVSTEVTTASTNVTNTSTDVTNASTDDANASTDGAYAALYNWLANYTCCDDSIDRIRHRAWSALGYKNDAALSPDIRAKLFTSPLVAEVSQLETFAACPFRHFVRHGLGLSERHDDDVSAGDLGQAFHRILKNVMDEGWLQGASAPDPEALLELLSRSTEAVGKSLRGELLLSTARNQYLLRRVERTLDQVLSAHQAAASRGKFRPAFVDVHFGPGGQIPALAVKTPQGHKLELTGRIDRVDLLDHASAAVVIDYKLSGGQLSLQRVYHGLSLQLLASMIAMQVHGQKLAQRPLTPAGGFNVQLRRSLAKGNPDEAFGPDDERYNLVVKPRGLFDMRYVQELDRQMGPGVKSDVLAVATTKEGRIGWRNSSDAVDPDEFTAILKLAAKKLREIGDQILSGRIDVLPYRINETSPCVHCEYKSVCRHDPDVNGYLHLPAMKREDVLMELGVSKESTVSNESTVSKQTTVSRDSTVSKQTTVSKEGA